MPYAADEFLKEFNFLFFFKNNENNDDDDVDDGNSKRHLSSWLLAGHLPKHLQVKKAWSAQKMGL